MVCVSIFIGERAVAKATAGIAAPVSQIRDEVQSLMAV